MALSVNGTADATVRVRGNGAARDLRPGDLTPTMRMSFDKGRGSLTFVIGTGARVLIVRDLGVEALVKAMMAKRLVSATPDHQYVVLLPSGSSYRAEGNSAACEVVLIRAELSVKRGYEGFLVPYAAPARVVRATGNCRAPPLGCRFKTSDVRLEVDIDLWTFNLALLHAHALDPLGSPRVVRRSAKCSQRFKFGLPSSRLRDVSHPPLRTA